MDGNMCSPFSAHFYPPNGKWSIPLPHTDSMARVTVIVALYLSLLSLLKQPIPHAGKDRCCPSNNKC